MKFYYVLAIAFLVSIVNIHNVFAAKTDSVENSFFSIKIPDNWAYREYSNTGMSQELGRAPINDIELSPSEFSDTLLNSNSEKIIEKIQHEGSAYAAFSQNDAYPIKNAPLESYVKFMINTLGIQNITSQAYTTIGKEKAIRINTNDSAEYGNLPVALYFIMHDKQPYNIGYFADPKNYEKYLPEFEQMVKSFRFANNPLSGMEKSENHNITNTKTNFTGANLTDYNASSRDNNPEDLYDECLGVAGKSLCDSLFFRNIILFGNRSN